MFFQLPKTTEQNRPLSIFKIQTRLRRNRFIQPRGHASVEGHSPLTPPSRGQLGRSPLRVRPPATTSPLPRFKVREAFVCLFHNIIICALSKLIAKLLYVCASLRGSDLCGRFGRNFV